MYLLCDYSRLCFNSSNNKSGSSSAYHYDQRKEHKMKTINTNIREFFMMYYRNDNCSVICVTCDGELGTNSSFDFYVMLTV